MTPFSFQSPTARVALTFALLLIVQKLISGSELRNWAPVFILTLIVVAVSSSAPAASAHAKFFNRDLASRDT
jgi:hypothetical protein